MSATAVQGGAATLLRSSLEERRGDLAGLLLWSLIEAIPALLSGRLVAWAIDRGFLAHRVGLGLMLLGLLALAVVIGSVGTRQAFARLAAVIEPFRDRLVRVTVGGALARAERGARDPGAVARLTQQVEIVRESYASVLMVAQGFVVTSTGALVGFTLVLPAALPLVAVPLAAALVLFALSVPRLARRQRLAILSDEDLAGVSESVVGALRDIAACGGEAAANAAVQRAITAQRDAAQHVARMTALRTLIIAVGGWLPIALILLRGPGLVHDGASAGAVMGALTYVLQGVYPSLHSLVNGLGSTGLWLAVTLRRLTEAAEDLADSRPTSAHLARPARDGSIAIRDLSFAYSARAAPVIEDLDLDLADGGYLAVVGPSGAGKSTLAALISGMLTPQRGRVLVGGAPVAAMDPATRGRHRVLVPQEAYVFAGTLRENLAYLAPDTPDARVVAAAESLGAAALLRRIGGLGAQVEPRLLTPAERQLVALVRAYLAPAPAVLLDEATCHLDAETEARAEQQFARRPGSLIVIAHRISSATRAPTVLVLDGARALLGTPDELLERSELYRDLVGHWTSGRANAPVTGSGAVG